MVKVVSSSQNASEEGRSIFYVEVVANRMFGSRMKNEQSGFVFKLNRSDGTAVFYGMETD